MPDFPECGQTLIKHWVKSDELIVVIGWTAPTRFEWWNGTEYQQERLWVGYDKWGENDRDKTTEDEFVLNQTHIIPSYIKTFNQITALSAFLSKHKISKDEIILTLLPGSRQQEVDKHLPVYLAAAKELQQHNPNLKVLVAKAPSVNLSSLYDDILVEEDNIRAAISFAKASITTSGTASLECAVLDTPQIVCYKLSRISGTIARHLNKSPFISMANLVVGKKIVPELIQKDVNKKV